MFRRGSDQAESRWRAKAAGPAPRRPEELASVRPEGGEEAIYAPLKPGLQYGLLVWFIIRGATEMPGIQTGALRQGSERPNFMGIVI